jgi:hypothetical protein
MATSEGIPKMDNGAIVLSEGRLDPSFGHHRIRITHTKLGGQKDASPFFRGKQGRSDSRASASKNQDIDIVVRVIGKVAGRRKSASGL